MPKNDLPRKAPTAPARNLWWRVPMKLRSLAVAAGVSVLFGLVSSQSYASCRVNLAEFVGWKIERLGIITGYIDKNGTEHDKAETCKEGRALIINHNERLACTGSPDRTSSIVIRPDVVILNHGDSIKACIDDRMYSIKTIDKSE